MGDMGDYFNDIRNDRKERRARLGIECPQCRIVRPKANPSILLPNQRCKVDGYRDPRPDNRLTDEATHDCPHHRATGAEPDDVAYAYRDAATALDVMFEYEPLARMKEAGE